MSKPVARFAVSPEVPSTADTIQLFDCSNDPEHVERIALREELNAILAFVE